MFKKGDEDYCVYLKDKEGGSSSMVWLNDLPNGKKKKWVYKKIVEFY